MATNDEVSSSDGFPTTVVSNVGTSVDIDDDSDEKIRLQEPISCP
jgi:hypothetical protein